MGSRNNNILIRKGFIASVAALVCFPAAIAFSAANSELPLTHGEIIHNDARITFEWPRPVHFTADASGTKLSITFEHKATPDFGALLSQLYPYVQKAERKSDGRTIVLTLDKPYPVRTFQSAGIDGVELLGVDTAPAELAALAPELSKLAPAAGEETPTPPKDAPEAKDAPNDSNAAPASEIKTPVSDKVKINVSAASDNAVLRIPFTERVGLAVFARPHMLWVVINKTLPLDLSDFDSLPKTVIGKAELTKLPKATVLRIPADDTVYANVTKEENSFNWVILLTPKKHAPSEPLKINTLTDPPAPPNVFISALEMARPVTIDDPLIGDSLIVTPLYNPGQGVAVPREFVEFTLLQTAQGIAVAKKADEVSVVELRNGLRIALPHGATLTPGLPDADVDNAPSASLGDVTMFPYDDWKPDDPEHVALQLNQLLHKIVESTNPQEANEARLRAAELHLSMGQAVEAISYLDGINRLNPAYYRSAKLAALHGAANFLMYRFSEAARDFSASELNNNKEMDYWRSMLSELLGNPEENYDFLGMNKDYISKYPLLLRQRLAIVAADRAIAAKEFNAALKILDTLHQDNAAVADPSDRMTVYVNFLLAKIASETGQEKDALDAWDKLAEDYKHPFVRARAEMLRIVWGLDHNTMTKDQAIDRLERLRLSWHGDGLELQALTMLGDLYADRKDYVNAMNVWNGGVVSFPNTTQAVEMARRMQEAFIIMFNDGAADSLPALDALALYYEYRNYMPSGNTGITMIEHLADRLVAVDLLDQGAALLDHQMRFQLEKEQRSRLGAKLAALYMLNHQPNKAMNVLKDSVYGDNALMLKLLRNRLAAQAMAEMGENDKALQTLGQDDTPDAEHIRLGIYWHEKDWQKVINSVEAMLKARKDVTAPVTLDESEFLLKLALAYVFENDTVQLQYLHDYFGPLMVNNPNKRVFDFITSSDVTLTTSNFDDVVKTLSDTRSFIENYRARIKTDGLDAMMKPAPANGAPTPPAAATPAAPAAPATAPAAAPAAAPASTPAAAPAAAPTATPPAAAPAAAAPAATPEAAAAAPKK